MAKLTLNIEFANRAQLDAFVQSRFGTDKEKNKDTILEISKEEMTKLMLDEATTVHGVQVREVKEEATPVKKEK